MKREIAYLSQNDCYKAALPLSPTGILVHSTGVNQKQISAYTSQWDRPGVAVCVHGFLGLDDSGELCYRQTLPYGFRCWGCGSGINSSFNASHIQFEICEDLPDAQWCRETYAAALEICRELCRAFSIAPENVVTHSEAHALGYASNHADVMHWWPKYGLDMDSFRRELAESLEGSDLSYERFREYMARYEAGQRALPPSAYAAESARKAVSSGIFADGNGDGSLDSPRSPLLRQELAVLLDRLGLLDTREEKE